MHGPNLDQLGRREPAIYGRTTLAEIDARLAGVAQERGVELECFQSNHEGALIERLHAAGQIGVDARGAGVHGVVINPAGLTHTSVVLRDALLSTGLPFVEVHLSNVHAREPFRRHSYFSDAAVGVVCGFGAESYELALRGLLGCAALRES